MPAAFSRLQLAAALLEYDNDSDNPDLPRRSAQESAIFAHLRRNPATRPELKARKSDYLGVSLPSETGSMGGRESALGTRRSRGSMDALRNPFGAEDTMDGSDDAPEEADIEVDLTSWGLDEFIAKDKSKSAKVKGKQAALRGDPSITTVISRRPFTNYDPPIASPRRALGTSRSMSVGGGLAFLDEAGSSGLGKLSENVDIRRRTVSSPLDLAGVEATGLPLQRRRAGSEAMAYNSSPQAVPFPTTSTRSDSPNFTETAPIRQRAYSRTSINSRMALEDTFEDMQAVRKRMESDVSMGAMPLTNDNPFALRPPSSIHMSRFDPKATRTRSVSNFSIGSGMPPDNDYISVATEEQYQRELRYSTTRDLLRPKVLVMPSPLQAVASDKPSQPTVAIKDGFQLVTDGPPLPPGARTSRKSSLGLSAIEASLPLASNSFTPNPLLDLSLSQKTFRNTLMLGDQQGPYGEGESILPRATQDGEQAQIDRAVEEEEVLAPNIGTEFDISKNSRPPGKLYGKSLIDDLEMRKAQMRSKQRVFTGDQRPSMMAREQTRSSTLIDPASLQARPVSQRLSSFEPDDSKQRGVARHSSLNIKPLLSFEDKDEAIHRPGEPNRLLSSRSVFGVDTIWESEMTRLREIQVAEQDEKERQQKLDEEELAKKEKKKKKKKRTRHGDTNIKPPSETAILEPRVSIEPPILPDIQRTARNAPPLEVSDGEESNVGSAIVPAGVVDPTRWHAGSSDEDDDGPRRVTGVGPRYIPKHRQRIDPDSEEDLPLAATVTRVMDRYTQPRVNQQESDDEEQPLSVLLQKSKSSLPSIDLHKQGSNSLPHEVDDDDVPLGLRASRIPPSFTGITPQNNDDDDRPLAFHPDQQRRTQYQMMAQAAHQQQIMMQAQLQSNMFFAPSISSGLYPTPIMNPMMMMQAAMSVPSPPPMQDEVKFGRVDQWRRDVAVEGPEPQ